MTSSEVHLEEGVRGRGAWQGWGAGGSPTVLTGPEVPAAGEGDRKLSSSLGGLALGAVEWGVSSNARLRQNWLAGGAVG